MTERRPPWSREHPGRHLIPIGPTAGVPPRAGGALAWVRWRRTATVTGWMVITLVSGEVVVGAARADALTVSGSSVQDSEPVPTDRQARPVGVIAWIDAVAISNPAADAVLIGFHEAAGPGPLPLVPEHVAHDLNAAVPRPAAAHDAAPFRDLDLVVLPTRGRGTGPTTAVDIAVPEGRPITSPVTGTVLAVDRYVLYGRTEDWIVLIAPDGRPDLAVKMIHVRGPTVAVGQRVSAGETTIAESSLLLPFASQIDRLTSERSGHVGPHVHLEVVPAP